MSGPESESKDSGDKSLECAPVSPEASMPESLAASSLSEEERERERERDKFLDRARLLLVRDCSSKAGSS